MRLDRLEVSGFRGINKPIKLDTNGKSLLLVGENGVGKTSVLQAIEWALLGEVAFLEGDEFQKEDALVNLFNEDESADVRIAIKDEKGTNLGVIRSRKKQSKTKGRSSLVIDVDGESLKAKSAEMKLAQYLGILPEEYSTTVHLHQEVIRELVEGSEKDRTRAINRVLGIDLLSNFGDALTKQLHSASVINRSFRASQGIVEQLSVQRTTIDDSRVEEEKALEGTRARLKEKGVDVGKLDEAIDSLFSDTKHAMHEIANELTAGNLASRLSSLETPRISKLEENLDDLKTIKRELASATTKLTSEVRNEILDLDLLQKQRASYLKQLTELKLKDKSEIDNKLNAVNSELAELDKLLKSLRTKERQLKGLEEDARRVLDSIDELSGLVSDINESFGDETGIMQKHRMLVEQEIQLKLDIDRVGVYNNLLNLAMTYLETTKQNECPVCERPIEYEKVLSSVQKRISEELAKHMQDLRQRLQKAKDDKEKLMEALKELQKLKKALGESQSKLGEVKKHFHEIAGLKLTEPIRTSIDNQIGEVAKIINENEQKMDKSKTIFSELRHAQSIIENLDSVENKISEAIAVTASGAELTKGLEKHINSKNEELAKLNLINERIEKLDERINLLEDIVTLFRRGASLDALEKSLKKTDEELLVQQEKLQKLQELVEALTDIRDAANKAKMETLEDILTNIADDINANYSRLLGHPFFIKLQLIPEEERETHIYRIMAQSKDNAYRTFVKTRFSQTQRNLVAISLFLAMAKRSSVGFVIIDDPSQSLDQEHKKAFIEVLRTLMHEAQVIVATQDEDLAGQMLKTIPSEKIKAYKLSAWNETGPAIQELG